MKPITKLIHSQISLLKPFISTCSLQAVRLGQDKIGKLMSRAHRADVTYEDVKIGSLDASFITPKDIISPGIILYLHGGGYTAGNLDYAKGFGTILSAKTSVRVLCLSYRLAPENVFPAALDDCFDAYAYLIANGYHPSQIILCGESAGGGLVYSLCEKLSAASRPLPAGIIAISPWTDLTQSGESYKANRDIDPSMTPERLKYFADCYLYGAKEDTKKELHPLTCEDEEMDRENKSNPLISPLFADLSKTKMPPSLIFVGADEIMLDDARLMHEKLLLAGHESDMTITKDMWHGYVLYNLKEYDNDFAKIRAFLKKHIAGQKKLRWMTLDNAAKIFPASRSRSWSNVFRISATLYDDIDMKALHDALDVTVRRFPSIAVRVKTGMFWYYLEEIPKAPDIMEEKAHPLSRMPFDDIRKCAFRVIVHEKRIAVEFFHALTDGNGGLVFVKTLVSEYLYQKYHVKVPKGNGVLDRLMEPSDSELEDSFKKNAGPFPASRKDTDAFKISGEKESDGYKTNVTFVLEPDEVKKRAGALGVTVTAYMAAALSLATLNIQKENGSRKEKAMPVKVLIPVNLRKIFNSGTLRNFVLYASPSIDPRLGEYTFEELCEMIHYQMKLQITRKNMAAMIATNVNSEKPLILKITPLFIKNVVMKLIFNAVGEKKSCFSFSNLGFVDMPKEFTDKVERLDFVLSVQSASPYNTSLITYGGKMNLNIIRNIKEPILERELYKVLKDLGLSVTLESNTREETKKGR